MKEVDKDINSRLSDWLKLFIQDKDIKKHIPFETDKWLEDQQECIESISEFPPDKCLDLLISSEDAYSRIEGNNHKLDKSYPYYSLNLVDILEKKDWECLKRHTIDFGTTMLRLGYRALCLLAQKRLYLYLVKEKTLNQLYVRYYNMVREDPGNEHIIMESYEQLRRYVTKDFSDMTGLRIFDSTKGVHLKDYTNLNDMNLLLTKRLYKNFPDNVRDSIIAAAKGQKNIRFLPKDVAWGLRKEYDRGKVVEAEKLKKEEIEKLKKANKDEDIDIFNQENKYGDNKVFDEVEVDEVKEGDPLVDVENIIFADQAMQAIKDPLDRKVAELYFYHDFDGREIAQRLPISKSKAYRIIQKLETDLQRLNQ